jgi:TolB protein
VYVIDADGANTRRVTFEGGYNDSPAWSPKGDKIAYSSMQGGKFDICLVGPDGARAQRITSDWGHNEYPTWSPDGMQIMFCKSGGGKSDLYVVRANGTDSRKITAVGNAKMPNWSQYF